MQVNANKEKICINQLVGQKNDIIEAEGDIIVNDIKPDVLNIINVSGNVCVYKKESVDGKIRLDGAVNVYVVYLADDEVGSLRSLNTTVDFTKVLEFDGCQNEVDIDEAINIKNIECKIINSRKIGIRAFLDLNIKLYCNDNVDIINDINAIEGVQSLNSMLTINSLIGKGVTKAVAKDTIIIDNNDNLAEVLKVDINLINKDIKISYNKVLAKADANVKIVYLTEENEIKSIEGNIPVMGFIDILNVSDSNTCNTRYKLKNIIVKPNNSEEHSIYVELELEISCGVYEQKQINVIQDLYSPINKVTFNQKKVTALVNKDNITDICKVQEQINIPELGNNKIYDTSSKLNIQTQSISNGKISFEGEIEVNYLCESNTSSKIESNSTKIPFKYSINNTNISENSNIDTNVEVKFQNIYSATPSVLNVEIELLFEIAISNREEINIIDNIDIEDKKDSNQHSVVIYFVKPKDTLWKIAKKFNSTVEEIAKFNNIENENKINPGMQLFIPKYFNRRTA